MSNQNETTQDTNATAPTVMAEGMRKASFVFRLVKATAVKYAETKEAFEANNITFETDIDEATKAIVGIRRSPVVAALPVYTAADFDAINPEFVQGLLNDAVDAVARDKFIDNLLDVDLEHLTVEDIINFASANRRNSALSAELVADVSKYVREALSANGTKPGTINTICEIIEGKFNKRVLTKYRKHENQFEGILRNIEMCYAIELDEENNISEFAGIYDQHSVAIKAFVDNLVAYFKELEIEDDTGLDLI